MLILLTKEKNVSKIFRARNDKQQLIKLYNIHQSIRLSTYVIVSSSIYK